MVTPAPKFTPGYRVKIGYLGLCHPDEQPVNRNGGDTTHNTFVLGIRFMFDIAEDEEGKEYIQPGQWEYQIWSNTPKGYREEGWYTESELVAKGYTPGADDVLDGESELEMLRRLA